MRELENYLQQTEDAVVLMRWDEQMQMFVAELGNMQMIDLVVEQEAAGRTLWEAVAELDTDFGVIEEDL